MAHALLECHLDLTQTASFTHAAHTMTASSHPAISPPTSGAAVLAIQVQHHTDRRDNCMKTHKTQVRQDRQHRCKTTDMLRQHHAVTATHCRSINAQPVVRIASRVHMHGGTYKAQGQMQPCIAQRTQTRRPECLPGPTGGQGILGRSATKTPTALARPACRPMGGGGRNIP